jgi:hypothetical protein
VLQAAPGAMLSLRRWPALRFAETADIPQPLVEFPFTLSYNGIHCFRFYAGRTDDGTIGVVSPPIVGQNLQIVFIDHAPGHRYLERGARM